jgi:hypothetical protein
MVTSAIFLCLVAPAIHREDPGVRKEIRAFFDRWESGMERKDIKSLIKLMDPRGQTVGLDGSVWAFSRAASDFPAMFAGFRRMDVRIRLDRIEQGGDEVVAWMTVRSTYEAKVHGEWIQSTKTSRHADTLKRFKDGWKCVFSQDLP